MSPVKFSKGETHFDKWICTSQQYDKITIICPLINLQGKYVWNILSNILLAVLSFLGSSLGIKLLFLLAQLILIWCWVESWTLWGFRGAPTRKSGLITTDFNLVPSVLFSLHTLVSVFPSSLLFFYLMLTSFIFSLMFLSHPSSL